MGGIFFPIVGKRAKDFSNHWKKRGEFSNHWKKSFQSLEKPGGALGDAFWGGAGEDGCGMEKTMADWSGPVRVPMQKREST
jgi:hypothetical protein